MAKIIRVAGRESTREVRFEHGDRRRQIGSDRGAALGGTAVAVGRPDAQDILGQAIVIRAVLADLTAAIRDGARDTAHRAAGERIRAAKRGERRIPGGGEARRIGAGAKAIGRLPALADGAAGRGDAAGCGEGGDEGGLPLGGHPSRRARTGMGVKVGVMLI